MDVAESSIAAVSRSSTGATAVSNADIPQFEKTRQLCDELEYTRKDSEKRYGLYNRGSRQTLPDAPRIPLDSCRLISYCLEDLDTPGMNRLGAKMWQMGPRPVIRSLSEQFTLGRRVTITENPQMHCVWDETDLFLKPLPAYVCSYAFWEYTLDTENHGISQEERDRLRRTALGFLRTYAALIRRRSDFAMARKHDLLPSFTHTTFEEFSDFIQSFENVPESAVSERWRLGELPLSPLNFYSIICLKRWHLKRYEFRYSAYFERYFPAVLFLFAIFSVILSAMQVILAGKAISTDNKSVNYTKGVCQWFAMEAIGWSTAFAATFLIWWIVISWADEMKKFRIKKAWKRKMALEESVQA